MIKLMPNLPDPAQNGGSDNTQVTSTVSGLHKEQEPLGREDSGVIEDTITDVEVSPELEKIGLVKRAETIDLPPDVTQMGVKAVGPAQPVSYTGAVQLPLTDDQIVVGLHAQILTSLRWLAEWCIRKLKYAHIHLKKVRGNVVRETR